MEQLKFYVYALYCTCKCLSRFFRAHKSVKTFLTTSLLFGAVNIFKRGLSKMNENNFFSSCLFYDASLKVLHLSIEVNSIPGVTVEIFLLFPIHFLLYWLELTWSFFFHSMKISKRGLKTSHLTLQPDKKQHFYKIQLNNANDISPFLLRVFNEGIIIKNKKEKMCPNSTVFIDLKSYLLYIIQVLEQNGK